MISEVIKQLEQHNLDGLWISDPETIRYLVGIDLNPMERFLGVYLQKDRKPLVLSNVLFVLKPQDHYELVEYYDFESVTDKMLEITQGTRIGIDKNLKAQYVFPLQKVKDCVIASDCVDTVRAIKTVDQIEKMKKASAVNDQVMKEIKSFLKVGVSELEVAEELERLFLMHGASGFSFEPIVAFGDHGADPHAINSDRRLKVNESIIVDIGCVVDGYCSDMTRTFFLEENPYKRAYQACLEANQKAIEAIKPNTTFAQLDEVARAVLKSYGYDQFFFHRLGHGIGQSVHEPYDVSMTNHQLIQPGMCFSIEPGIYVENEFGIRIEDLVYVDEQGFGQLLNHVDKTNPIISKN